MTNPNNHEIRFKVNKEQKELAKKLRDELATELVLSAFYKQTFFLGINQLQDQKLKNKNSLLELVKGGLK